eukprot:Skav221393  [mRNA]  locus=scaffold1029:181234:182634:+ [translate_table: standard]
MVKKPASLKRAKNPKDRPKKDGKNSKHWKRESSPRSSSCASGNSGPLRDLLTSSLPDPTQLEAVQTCLEHVQVLACQILGENSAVVVQGSYAQGLALRGSDLDIAVILPGHDSKSTTRSKRGEAGEDVVKRQQALQCLQRLARALSEANLEEIRIALKIFSAKVPVLRLHCGAKGERNVVVDVSVGGSLLRGACDRAVYSVLQQDRSNGGAAALCRLVKLWAKRRKLTNTLKGGLSSFACVLLTVFFLQQRSAKALPCLPPQQSVTPRAKPANTENCCPQPLGLQVRMSEDQLLQSLTNFFKWATEELPKFQNQTISIGSATVEPRPGRFHPLILEVPFSPKENAARCLRIDVWDSICQELHRANHLVQQLAGCRGAARASVVRSLFSADPAQDVFPEAEPLADSVDEPPELDDSKTWDTKATRRSAKRRRKLERRKARSQPGGSKAETVAPVDRWLGLRSLLDPR